jgi:hypothetical protein
MWVIIMGLPYESYVEKDKKDVVKSYWQKFINWIDTD